MLERNKHRLASTNTDRPILHRLHILVAAKDPILIHAPPRKRHTRLDLDAWRRQPPHLSITPISNVGQRHNRNDPLVLILRRVEHGQIDNGHAPERAFASGVNGVRRKRGLIRDAHDLAVLAGQGGGDEQVAVVQRLLVGRRVVDGDWLPGRVAVDGAGVEVEARHVERGGVQDVVDGPESGAEDV